MFSLQFLDHKVYYLFFIIARFCLTYQLIGKIREHDYAHVIYSLSPPTFYIPWNSS